MSLTSALDMSFMSERISHFRGKKRLQVLNSNHFFPLIRAMLDYAARYKFTYV